MLRLLKFEKSYFPLGTIVYENVIALRQLSDQETDILMNLKKITTLENIKIVWLTFF